MKTHEEWLAEFTKIMDRNTGGPVMVDQHLASSVREMVELVVGDTLSSVQKVLVDQDAIYSSLVARSQGDAYRQHDNSRRVLYEIKRLVSELVPQPLVANEVPKWEHDCEKCLFLGRYKPGRAGAEFDLYFCDRGAQTVIARYGSGGQEYVSGLPLALHVPELAEARRRAELRKLFM